MGFVAFFGEEKLFPVKGTDLNIVTRWRCDKCRNVRENFKNLGKWVQSLCAPLRPFRSELEENITTAFYRMYCRCAPMYKYFATLLQGATKNCQVRTGGTKSAR